MRLQARAGKRARRAGRGARRAGALGLALMAVLATGCRRASRTAPAASGCTPAQRVAFLPKLLRETSGLAASRRHPGVLWTHDDSGGEPALYALDAGGRLLGTVRVTGAVNVDWEDIALGPCATGDCLYIGDIGDNEARRPSVQIYRVPEPAPGAAQTAPAERVSVTYPDGARDAEALYVLPDASVYIVSKGRKGPVAVYRVPAMTSGASAPLVRIQELWPNGSERGGLVTGADATADGAWVAIRTYEVVRLYRTAAGGRLVPVPPLEGAPLDDAGEPQGEALAFGRGDTLWLSSEAGAMGDRATLSRLRCTLRP